MRVLVLGDLDSVHTRRWISAVSATVQVVAVGFGAPPTGVESHSLGSSPATTARQIATVPRIAEIVRRMRPDLIHAHFVSSYGVLAALAGRGTPLVMSAWGSDILLLPTRPGALKRAVVAALERASVVTYDATDVGHRVAELAPGTETAEVVFGPPASWCDAPRTDAKVILSPRLPEPLYGIEHVIEAFARAGLEGWRLEVLSSGRPTQHLEELAASLGIAPRVSFQGFLSRDEMQRRFLLAEAFCSTPRSDATAASLLEGMASGSFPIATDLPANRRWIRSGSNGFLVPFADVGAMADAMQRAASDPDLRAKAAGTNRVRIRRDATWEIAVGRTLEIYSRVGALTRKRALHRRIDG